MRKDQDVLMMRGYANFYKYFLSLLLKKSIFPKQEKTLW